MPLVAKPYILFLDFILIKSKKESNGHEIDMIVWVKKKKEWACEFPFALSLPFDAYLVINSITLYL